MRAAPANAGTSWWQTPNQPRTKNREWPQAIGEYQKAVELSQGSPPALASLGYAYGLSGNQNDARRVIAHLQEASKHHYVSAFDMAVVFAATDRDSAFPWLEKAYAARDSQMAFLNVTRRLDSLRSDPRLADLLHRMALPSIPPQTDWPAAGGVLGLWREICLNRSQPEN